MTQQDLILPMPGNEAFAAQFAQACGGELGRVETRRFPDGESYVRLLADPAGRTVRFVCTLADPDSGFLRLVYAADAARDLGARSVGLVAPYLAYMRQDKRFLPGESISSRPFARIVSQVFDHLATVDPHLHRYAALSDLYTIPALALQAAAPMADWIAANVTRPLIIGPDEESAQWAGAIAARVGAPCTVLRKVRHGDRQVDITLPDMTAWRGHQPVLVDDIASSGRTLIGAARQLVAQGLPRPECVVAHALFGGDAFEQLAPHCVRITSTDTVPHASNRIPLAAWMAGALQQGSADLAA